MRIEEADLVYVSGVQCPRQQIHGGISLTQPGGYASAPVAGLPAPEGPLERDQQPADSNGFSAVAALRRQRAEQTCVARVARVTARQLRGDGVGGVCIAGRIVCQGALEALVFVRAFRCGLARQPGKGSSERDTSGHAVAVRCEVERRFTHHRCRQSDRVRWQRLDLVEALDHLTPAPQPGQGQQLHAERREVSRKALAGSARRSQLPIVLAEQMVRVR